LTLIVRIQEPPVELGIQIACLREFLLDRAVYGAMATEAQIAQGQQGFRRTSCPDGSDRTDWKLLAWLRDTCRRRTFRTGAPSYQTNI
jgi:hypothetical protein